MSRSSRRSGKRTCRSSPAGGAGCARPGDRGNRPRAARLMATTAKAAPDLQRLAGGGKGAGSWRRRSCTTRFESAVAVHMEGFVATSLDELRGRRDLPRRKGKVLIRKEGNGD